MDELYFDNKKYVTTKKAAALANYAKDYVGQLARAGKIDARLIGRNWYISEEALLEHAFGGKVKSKSAGEGVISKENEASVPQSDSMESDQESISTWVSPTSDSQSKLQQPIQKNGLDVDVSAHDNLQDEIENEGVETVSHDYGSPITYWNDDSVLIPTMSQHDDSSDGGGHEVPPQNPKDYDVHYLGSDTHQHGGDGVRASDLIQHEDVSKITLTLRNRLRENASQYVVDPAVRVGYQAKLSNSQTQYDASHADDGGDGWRVDTAMIVKVGIFLICFAIFIALVFAMTGETSTVYIRQ